MLIKTFFFSKSSLSAVIINKYLVQTFYTKYFICKLFLKKRKKFILVDTYVNKFFVISKMYKILFLLKLLKRGSSIIADLCIYKNSSLYSLFFEGIGIKRKSHNIVTSFYNRLKVWAGKKEVFFIYKVCRGGYFGFSRGLKGLLPAKHLFGSFEFFKTYKKYLIVSGISGSKFSKSYFSTIKFSFGGIVRNFVRSSVKQRVFIFGKVKYLFSFDPTFCTLWLTYLQQQMFLNFKHQKYIYKYTFKKILQYLL